MNIALDSMQIKNKTNDINLIQIKLSNFKKILRISKHAFLQMKYLNPIYMIEYRWKQSYLRMHLPFSFHDISADIFYQS